MKPTELEKNIRKALKVLQKGGLIIYPTESSYAIGADATNEVAVRRVYEVKKRPLSKKLNVIVGNLKVARKYGVISCIEERFLLYVYPKPLTLVTRKKPSFPS